MNINKLSAVINLVCGRYMINYFICVTFKIIFAVNNGLFYHYIFNNNYYIKCLVLEKLLSGQVTYITKWPPFS